MTEEITSAPDEHEEGHAILKTLATDDLRGPCEAILLVSVDPVGSTTIAQMLDADTRDVERVLETLSNEYRSANRGFQLRKVAGGWRLFTHHAHHQVIEEYVRSWDSHRLTQAALETLAVIAYQQPATREGVRGVRGVNSDSAISSLIEKGLVRELGRREGAGPMLYGTTRAFLERYGLASLADLPPLEDFAPDEQTRQLIADRLSGTSAQQTFDDLEDLDESDEGHGLEPEDVDLTGDSQ